MSDTVISVEGVSKRYAIGTAEKAGSFREAVSGMLTAPFKRLGQMASGGGTEEFWALKDVNFEVKRGEVVGIIGRNGAGKSTLLKVLSRITPPTEGRIKVRGRIASLLEVGTGFHPELTGRENIYLNGAMLGMGRNEIRRKFDEIVAFSEVEKFLDTPVKRYSSGMYVRLAFAVAAHLEPEILIVDEVLAVGDAQFQKKCLGKMKEVSEGGGRTVLFVSHNMAAVRSLCDSALMIRSGTVLRSGAVSEVVSAYLSAGTPDQPIRSIDLRTDRRGSGRVRFTDIRIVDPTTSQSRIAFAGGDPMRIEIGYKSTGSTPSGHFTVNIHTVDGFPVTQLENVLVGSSPATLGERGVASCLIPEIMLSEGQYVVSVKVAVDMIDADDLSDALRFSIEGCSRYSSHRSPHQSFGLLLCDQMWNVQIDHPPQYLS